MHSNAYNMIKMITMIQSPFRTVYIYLPEGVTQPSRACSDTILCVSYNIEFTDNINKGLIKNLFYEKNITVSFVGL